MKLEQEVLPLAVDYPKPKILQLLTRYVNLKYKK